MADHLAVNGRPLGLDHDASGMFGVRLNLLVVFGRIELYLPTSF